VRPGRYCDCNRVLASAISECTTQGGDGREEARRFDRRGALVERGRDLVVIEAPQVRKQERRPQRLG
jgi:hypothetical protein